MRNATPHLLDDVAAYYTSRLAEFGQTPQGVDWNSERAQTVRFEQIAKILPTSDAYSINDVGCGYGALVDFLDTRPAAFCYAGNDISAAMVAASAARFDGRQDVRFDVGSVPTDAADYCVASGIFNVTRGHTGDDWLSYIHATLDVLHAKSQRGFAFNCLTSYSDVEYMQPDKLYYADPCQLFDRCKRLYSRQVALLHDYGLYEFTILVRKDA